MSKNVVILQSNYIPWKGYFDLMNMADEFVLYDDVQYTRRDWRNRNMIKTSHGLKWLTIPVDVKGKYHQLICDTLATDDKWRREHWNSIVHAYGKSPHFGAYADALESLYMQSSERKLSQINRTFMDAICSILGITTRISWSMDFAGAREIEDKTARLVHICKLAGATHYISGPAARGYIKDELFDAAGIALSYMDYSGYPEYPQMHGAFEHGVSVLDLIFNAGPEATSYMKSFTRKEARA